LAVVSWANQLMPVALPPGRAKLVTRSNLTGSSVTPKTIGIVLWSKPARALVVDPRQGAAVQHRECPMVELDPSALFPDAQFLPPLGQHHGRSHRINVLS
jgi:hypothetical protein